MQARLEARAEVRDLLAWRPVPVDGVILDHAWRLQGRYQLAFWDSLIVAAAKSASCRYLLSEEFQTGQDIDGLVIINPFRSDPVAVLGA